MRHVIEWLSCARSVGSHVSGVSYFRLKEEKSKTAECNLCNASVSQGGSSVGNFNTANMINHLPKYQRKEYMEFIQASNVPKKHTNRKYSEA